MITAEQIRSDRAALGARAAMILIGSVCMSLVGCARHVVIEREQGRMDATRSISTRSETAWSVKHEPEPARETGQR